MAYKLPSLILRQEMHTGFLTARHLHVIHSTIRVIIFDLSMLARTNQRHASFLFGWETAFYPFRHLTSRRSFSDRLAIYPRDLSGESQSPSSNFKTVKCTHRDAEARQHHICGPDLETGNKIENERTHLTFKRKGRITIIYRGWCI